jgi:aspartyl-tRNA synthetase
MALSEELIKHCWRLLVQPDFPNNKFPIITYKEAMDLYGTDKPDTRFEMKVMTMESIMIE